MSTTHTPNTIAVKLSPKAETILKKGHPWIFSDSIVKVPADAAAGDVAIIFSQSDNKVIGVGLYDPTSPIRIKILKANGGLRVDDSFFATAIHQAFTRRQAHFDPSTTAYRLVYGESDALPGLIVDVYESVAVIKVYSEIWLPYLDWIQQALVDTLLPQAIVARWSRNVSKAHPHLQDGTLLYGTLEDPVIVFSEYGIRFSAHVIAGHKTGYFLDHRYNRHQVGLISKGKTVLDVFAYAGGFSVHALMGGATAVTSLDISAQALEVAKANAALNTFSGNHTTLTGDAFALLIQMIREGAKYDIVVIDPPSFAKQQSEVTTALKQYEKLAHLGVQLTKKGGTLVLASCSSRVKMEEWLPTHQQAFAKTNRAPRLIKQTLHDWDHPVTIPEMAYLKTAYYQL